MKKCKTHLDKYLYPISVAGGLFTCYKCNHFVTRTELEKEDKMTNESIKPLANQYGKH